MKPSISKINRDKVFNNVSHTSSQKVPRYPDLLSSLGTTPGFQGDLAFQTSDNTFYGHDGTVWVPLSSGSSGASIWTLDNGNFIQNTSVSGVVFGENNLLFGSPTTDFSSYPNRLFYIPTGPNVGAFRVGGTSGAQWDSANIGQYSFAGGLNNIAEPTGSFIGAGIGNNIIFTSTNSAIVAGVGNTVNDSSNSFIGAGQGNSILLGNSAILAGTGNTVSSINSSILSGSSQQVITPNCALAQNLRTTGSIMRKWRQIVNETLTADDHFVSIVTLGTATLPIITSINIGQELFISAQTSICTVQVFDMLGSDRIIDGDVSSTTFTLEGAGPFGKTVAIRLIATGLSGGGGRWTIFTKNIRVA